MTELRLLQIIGEAQDSYILEADELWEGTVFKKKTSKFLFRVVAAIFAVAVGLGLFLRTPTGIEAVEQIKNFINILFPPKEDVVYIEGLPETVSKEAFGREPEGEVPGFSIYVDTSMYTMTEEKGAWFIRPILTNESMPVIEMEIREVLDKEPQKAAEEIYLEMEGDWENLVEHFRDSDRTTPSIYASNGNGWDSAWEDHVFLDNSRGGSFHVIMRSYQEASGHGTRFRNMLDSFRIIAPQDISGYEDAEETLIKAMEKEVEFGKKQEKQLLDSAYEYNKLWQEVFGKVWATLEQSLDEKEMEILYLDQLEWASEKRKTLNKLEKEQVDYDLQEALIYEENGKLTKERVEVLLSYLKGTSQPMVKMDGQILSPDKLVESFTAAYFCNDAQVIKSYLSEEYSGDIEIYSNGTEIMNAVKGLDKIPQKMTEWGYITPSIEFRENSESDSYTYLSMTLIWEKGEWKVLSYGVEK